MPAFARVTIGCWLGMGVVPSRVAIGACVDGPDVVGCAIVDRGGDWT